MATASLKWTVPTTRVDGSPLASSDVALIDVFDSASTTPDAPIATVQGAGTEFISDVLTVGTHNFTVVVQDTTGHRSAASNVASLDVPAVLANPSAVTDLAATLNP